MHTLHHGLSEKVILFVYSGNMLQNSLYYLYTVATCYKIPHIICIQWQHVKKFLIKQLCFVLCVPLVFFCSMTFEICSDLIFFSKFSFCWMVTFSISWWVEIWNIRAKGKWCRVLIFDNKHVLVRLHEETFFSKFV